MRETHERKLAKMLGEMKFEAIVGPVVPKGSDAIGFLENERRDSIVGKGSGGG